MKTLNYDYKMKFINIIDRLNTRLKNTIYERELREMRSRYIYKDVSLDQGKVDYFKLCCYKDIVKRNKK